MLFFVLENCFAEYNIRKKTWSCNNISVQGERAESFIWAGRGAKAFILVEIFTGVEPNVMTIFL